MFFISILFFFSLSKCFLCILLYIWVAHPSFCFCVSWKFYFLRKKNGNLSRYHCTCSPFPSQLWFTISCPILPLQFEAIMNSLDLFYPFPISCREEAKEVQFLSLKSEMVPASNDVSSDIKRYWKNAWCCFGDAPTLSYFQTHTHTMHTL